MADICGDLGPGDIAGEPPTCTRTKGHPGEHRLGERSWESETVTPLLDSILPPVVCSVCAAFTVNHVYDCPVLVQHTVNEDTQCQAMIEPSVDDQGLGLREHYRCEMIAGHAYNHKSGSVRWVDLVAVYPKAEADTRQVGGDHYATMKIRPWEVIDALGLDYYRGTALAYLMRAGRKGPALEDLKKAKHLIEKCIENEESS